MYKTNSNVWEVEGNELSTAEELKHWANLIESGQCWTLQGWYGRTARELIENNIITAKGEIILNQANYSKETIQDIQESHIPVVL